MPTIAARSTSDFHERVRSLQRRISALTGLRDLVRLPAAVDLTSSQWSALQAALSGRTRQLRCQLTRVVAMQDATAGTESQINQLLGQMELDLNRAYEIYDTYLDVLSQRLVPGLGPLLAGCDVLAADVMKRPDPLLQMVEAPLVYCDRGFGASMLRAEVEFPDGTLNPMPLIQIPYARLQEKCNLTSILHEAGHEISHRLQLARILGNAVYESLTERGCPESVCQLYQRWCHELVPDFIGFCASGLAAAATVRDILTLPDRQVFRLDWFDPHPPPFIRVLVSIECCRQEWGRGMWDDWEVQWLRWYPLQSVSDDQAEMLKLCLDAVSAVVRTLRTTRIAALQKHTIAQLFDMDKVHPIRLRQIAQAQLQGKAAWETPCVQLGVFYVAQQLAPRSSDSIATATHRWLSQLSVNRKNTLNY